MHAGKKLGLATSRSAPHAVSEDPEVLNEISHPDVNLALWQRPAVTSIQQELTSLKALDLPDKRQSTTLSTFDIDVCKLLLEQGLDPNTFGALRADMRLLTDLLWRASGSPRFIFRLVTITGDECRRFHLDRTPLRLICTYQGPGTEWLPDWQVDRAALLQSASNEAITLFGDPSQFAQFWVGIMRGDPARRGRGLVHRSPPVAGTGRIRVLFCLDSATPPDSCNPRKQDTEGKYCLNNHRKYR